MGGIGGQVRERKTEKKSEEKIYSLKRELLFRPFKILIFYVSSVSYVLRSGMKEKRKKKRGKWKRCKKKKRKKRKKKQVLILIFWTWASFSSVCYYFSSFCYYYVEIWHVFHHGAFLTFVLLLLTHLTTKRCWS